MKTIKLMITLILLIALLILAIREHNIFRAIKKAH